MNYIQRKGQGYHETVGEFDTIMEARIMLREYCQCDPSAYYYISTRSCRTWKKQIDKSSKKETK